MTTPKISLDQWRALAAVVDEGGYAQAAVTLYKSQSAVTYAVQKLESVLGVKVFDLQGRRAVLTPTGTLLYRRASALIAEAAALERAAAMLAAGWEAEIRLAIDVVFPTTILLAALDRFGNDSPHTRIELIESVLGGTTEALLQGRVDLAVGAQIPQGFLGEPLLPLSFEPVAHPQHPLHQLGRAVTLDDLREYRQLVVRDSGSDREASPLALEARQRWTVGNMSTAILAAAQGYGYGWYPCDKIRDEIEAGRLKPLPMGNTGSQHSMLYLVFADRDAGGLGVRKLAERLRECVGGLGDGG
jgi:DNA-binding transcriptional LysR family regulator